MGVIDKAHLHEDANKTYEDWNKLKPHCVGSVMKLLTISEILRVAHGLRK